MGWSSKLTIKLAVRDQPEALATLRDAAEYLQAYYANANVQRSLTFKTAIQDLMDAALSGKKADIEAATFKVRAFLAEQGLLSGERRKSTREVAMDVQQRLKAELERQKRRK